MKHKETVMASAYCLDKNMRVSPMHLLGFMLDSAAAHCIKPGITGPDMQKKGLTWVITHFTTRFNRFPSWRDSLRVETWASKRKGFKTQREFVVLSEKDEKIAIGASIWTILDLATRRPVPVNIIDEKLTQVEFDEFALPEWKPGRLSLVEDGERYRQDKTVSYFDIDFNRHLNSLKSLEWAMNTLPLVHFEKYSLADLNIQFLGEAFFGDLVDVDTVFRYPEASHCLKNKESGKELCRITSLWQTIC